MILRRADGIAAARTTPPACPILSLLRANINATSCHREWRVLLMDCSCSHDTFGNLSKNRSVGEDLYKCKGIRLLQAHSYWDEGRGKVKLCSFKTPVSNQNWEGGNNIYYEFQL